jgi:hypothetical protein
MAAAAGLSPAVYAQSLAEMAILPEAPQPQVAAPTGESSSSDPAQAAVQEQKPQPPIFPQTPEDAAKPPPPDPKPRTSDEVLRQEEKQRLLGVVPTFNAVNGAEKIPPLRPGQKFHLFFKSSTDVFVIGLDAVVAGIGQAEDSNSGVETVKNADGTTRQVRYGFGQGAAGYFKRFGSSYADTFDGNFWGNAVLPVLLREDPRYYRLGTGSGLRRFLYAASTTVWARRDNGKWGPNYANVGGNFIGGAISNLYYPSQEGGISKTIVGALTVTAEGTFGAELIEFSPEITTHVLRRKSHPAL